MDEITLVNFLDQYTSRYHDYEIYDQVSSGKHINNEYFALDNSPICFDTASYIEKKLSTDNVIVEIKINNLSDVLKLTPYLDKKYYFAVNYGAQFQCHELGIISMGTDINYVIQSMGGLLTAHYVVLSDKELIEALIRLALGDTMTLFHIIDEAETNQYDYYKGTVDTKNGKIAIEELVEGVLSNQYDAPILNYIDKDYRGQDYVFSWSLSITVKELRDEPLSLPDLSPYDDVFYQIRQYNIDNYAGDDRFIIEYDKEYPMMIDSFERLQEQYSK